MSLFVALQGHGCKLPRSADQIYNQMPLKVNQGTEVWGLCFPKASTVTEALNSGLQVEACRYCERSFIRVYLMGLLIGGG